MSRNVLISLVIAASLLTLALSACQTKTEGDKKEAEKTEKAKGDEPAKTETPADKPAEPTAKGKLSAADNPVEGDSCEGLGAMDGVMACDGQKIIFCSSYSSYKWTLQQTCPDGQTCNLAADGKAAGCK